MLNKDLVGVNQTVVDAPASTLFLSLLDAVEDSEQKR